MYYIIPWLVISEHPREHVGRIDSTPARNVPIASKRFEEGREGCWALKQTERHKGTMWVCPTQHFL